MQHFQRDFAPVSTFRIQFRGDSRHGRSGVVPMPAIPDYLAE
jgi:hypothetical protein